MGKEHKDAEALLAQFSAAECTYLEWIQVGMALKEEGYPIEVWDRWSLETDPGRYHEGECSRKWASFSNGSSAGRKDLTGATLAQIAKDHGAELSGEGRRDEAFDWDDYVIATAATDTVVDKAYVDSTGKQFGLPENRRPNEHAKAYLSALFEADDIVAFTTTAYPADDGRFKPYGYTSQSAHELLQALETCGDDIGKVFGDPTPKEAGMWICLNPTDGKGRQNANITDWRYTLVECDHMGLDMQVALYKALNLPCAALVYSGGKSVHAVVHVDATSATEYRARVERVYKECVEAGIDLDPQNKNASRLSRMPGAMRGDTYQELLAVNVGAQSYDQWIDWLAQKRDDLPNDADISDIGGEVPLPQVVLGTSEAPLLRLGDKAILTGDSKGHKTTTVIDLAIAVSTGARWLGIPCAEGPVYYVDLETSRAHFLKRVQAIWADRVAHGADSQDYEKLVRNFKLLCLKGHSMPLKDLAPKLIRRVCKCCEQGPGKVSLIIIDPIYKVMGGNESDMEAVSDFTNTLDAIVTFTGASLLYLHHHTKGASGAKKALDRSSGSGVFSRDADAVIDITELYVPEEDRARMGIQDGNDVVRMEMVFRYSKPRAPIDMVFKWPRFYKTDQLSSYELKGADPLSEAKQSRKANQEKKHDAIVTALRAAIGECRAKGAAPNRSNVLSLLQADGVTRDDGRLVDKKTLQRWTIAASSPWCPIRCDPETYELYDEEAKWYDQPEAGE